MKEMEKPNNNQYEHHLGVNKLGRTIKKIPAAPARRLPPPPPQARVYNIKKSDFRSVVQQLTGTPTRGSFPAAAATIPHPPRHPGASLRLQQIRPPPLAPLPRPNPDPTPSNFDYMRFLENSLLHSDGSRPTPPPPGLPAFPSPRSGPLLQSPGPLALQSPSSFLNLFSPRSPYLLSPGIQHPTPLTPSLPLSPGFLRPRPPLPPPPPSPGFFPPSPSGLLPFFSPGWKDL